MEVEYFVDKVDRRDAATMLDGAADPAGFGDALLWRNVVRDARQAAQREPIERRANHHAHDQRPHDVLLAHANEAPNSSTAASIGILPP